MSRGTAARRRGLAAAALALLAGCGAAGPEGTGGTGEATARAVAVVAQAQRVLGGLGTDTGVGLTRPVPGGFAPEALAAEPDQYRLIMVNALGLAEPARVIQANGRDLTLALQSGPTASFRDGILVATRGFPEDLTTLEATGLRAALAAGGGAVTRRMEMLDDQDQIRTETFACTITGAGTETVDLGFRQAEARRLDERCQGEALIFDNIYWLDGAGELLSSRQFVSPSVAYLRASRL